MGKKKEKVARIILHLGEKYSKDFKKWAEDCISFDGLKLSGLTDQQIEASEALIKYKRLSVSGGGGLGKSALAALLILWFMSTRLNTKVPTTAPTSNQLFDVLWTELDIWLSRYRFKDIFEKRTKRLFLKGFREWFATARTVPKDANLINDTMAGFHAQNLFFVVDEASGVPDPVYTAIEGSMTHEDPFILLISNPVSTGGYYYDTITDPEGKGGGYKVLNFSSLESPLVSKAYAERIALRYGKDSAMYKAKVLGQPVDSLENSVVSPTDFDRIILENRELQKGSVTLGIDIGETSDPTVICHKIGNSIIRWDSFIEPDSLKCANTILFKIKECNYKNPLLVVDAIGVGAGVYSFLSQTPGLRVEKFKGSEKPKDEESYTIRRAEGYYLLKKCFGDLQFPRKPPETLRKELCNIIFDLSSGMIGIETKKKLISRISHSPNHADALMMACYPESFFLRVAPKFVSKGVKNFNLAKTILPNSGARYEKFARFL